MTRARESLQQRAVCASSWRLGYRAQELEGTTGMGGVSPASATPLLSTDFSNSSQTSVPDAGPTLTPAILIVTPREQYHSYPHSTAEETEAWRDEITGL